MWSAIFMSEGILERSARSRGRAGRRGDGGNLRLRYENAHRSIKYHMGEHDASTRRRQVRADVCSGHTASNTIFNTANITLG